MAYTTIKKPSDYFNTKLYSGNSGTQSITSVGFQPDFTWIKRRTGTGAGSLIFDVVRGATNFLGSNDTAGNQTDVTTLTSFDTNGFTLGSSAGVNGSGENYASWNWLGANGTASNTDGSISSTVSANTTSGFSIVSYTGTGSNATVGHGLGSAPQVVIIKDRSVARDWIVGDTAIGFDKYLLLNSTTASITASNRFQDTAPSSSVVTIGTHGYVNNSGNNYIAYCFAEKQGFSKFGSYTGNGSADGTFVYTGFKPAFVIAKCSSAVSQWGMKDIARNPYNVLDKSLFANLSNAEETNREMDFLSNGFKLRSNAAGDLNDNGSTYIYMAFAEEPLVGDNPATAR
jgi:hypothetical protein